MVLAFFDEGKTCSSTKSESIKLESDISCETLLTFAFCEELQQALLFVDKKSLPTRLIISKKS